MIIPSPPYFSFPSLSPSFSPSPLPLRKLLGRNEKDEDDEIGKFSDWGNRTVQFIKRKGDRQNKEGKYGKGEKKGGKT